MWKLYTASNESVCIQSTYRRLREVLSEDRFAVSVVRYIDYESEWLPEGNLMYPYVHKRRSFAHERGLRALHFDPPPATLQGEGTIDFAHEPSNAGNGSLSNSLNWSRRFMWLRPRLFGFVTWLRA